MKTIRFVIMTGVIQTIVIGYWSWLEAVMRLQCTCFGPDIFFYLVGCWVPRLQQR